MATVLSVQFFPRYKMSGRHLVPLVTSACRRTLYDNGSVDLKEISVEEYHAATKADDAVIGVEKEGK